MLDTVDLPMWLSGIRNASATGLSMPIWWRTCVRSGRVAGSISQMISKLLGTRNTLPGRGASAYDNAPGGASGTHDGSQSWQHGDVTATPGHPPLDFSPLGLARWSGPKWVEFFQGTIGKAVSSVVLAHFVEGGELILVKTAPRQRWDSEMGGGVEGEMNPGRGSADFAFDLVRQMTDSGRPALDGNAALEGEERASYNRGLVTYAEDRGAEWETWEPALWCLGDRNVDARIFRFAHAWAGFSVDDPDRYVGVIAYNVKDTFVRLDTADDASYSFDFSKPFGIEDLQAQVGSRPDVESVIRAPSRCADHEAVVSMLSRVISSNDP